MQAPDDGIANLQRFIANLTVANGALAKIAEHLEGSARDFEHIENVAADQGGGLNERLEEFRSRLDAEQAEVGKAIEEVAQAAAHGQARLGEAEGHLEQAGGRFEEKAHAVSTHLDEEHSQLVDHGFTLLGQALEESERELERAGQESRQAFGQLGGTLQGFEAEARSAWDGEETALEQAASALSDEESVLATEATDAVEAFASTGADLESACSALEADVGAVYDGFASGVDATGQELAEASQNLLQEAAGFVEAGGHGRLEEPADALEEDGLAPLAEEYASLEAALATAAATAGELEPLADELAKCQAVVGEIDRLLNALAG